MTQAAKKNPGGQGKGRRGGFSVTEDGVLTTYLVNMNPILDYHSPSDRRLVELHLHGDRDAFRQIVERHQAMVCALGLSACGDVARSEDIAQEVFLVAWKQLPELREPEKLRGWLAGITRNLINNSFRGQRRTPTARAEELSVRLPDDGGSPREQAISADEASLMWQALAGIPENYREPMVLFYREQRSVTAVAATLEISEEAVRQRLVRGRAMLTERMAKLVEETLERSAPTPTFAGAVMLAVPFGAAPAGVVAEAGFAGAKAAAGGVGLAAGKVGMAAKVLSIAGLFPIVLNGFLEFIRFRASYDEAGSGAKRSRVTATYLVPNLKWLVMALVIIVLNYMQPTGSPSHGILEPHLVALLGFVLVTSVLLARWQKRCAAEDARGESSSANIAPVANERSFEYRSRLEFWGMPLLHVQIAGPKLAMRRTARGWIALSDGIALGGIFAYGGKVAVAPVSLGVTAIGLVSLGFVSMGAWAVGMLAGGLYVLGAGAFGGVAAQGGYVVSKGFALGNPAFGPHANDAAAKIFIQEHVFFRIADTTIGLVGISLFFLWLPPLLLICSYLWRKRTTR